VDQRLKIAKTFSDGYRKWAKPWYLDSYVVGLAHGSLIAIEMRIEEARSLNIPCMQDNEDMQHIAKVAKDFIGGEGFASRELDYDALSNWAGSHDAELRKTSKVRVGDSFGIPFDCNAFSRLLDGVFGQLAPTAEMAIEMYGDDKPFSLGAGISYTTSLMRVVHKDRLFTLARLRNSDDDAPELIPIGDALEKAESAFDRAMGKLEV